MQVIRLLWIGQQPEASKASRLDFMPDDVQTLAMLLLQRQLGLQPQIQYQDECGLSAFAAILTCSRGFSSRK